MKESKEIESEVEELPEYITYYMLAYRMKGGQWQTLGILYTDKNQLIDTRNLTRHKGEEEKIVVIKLPV